MSTSPYVDTSRQFSVPLIGALAVHLIIAGLLFGSWNLSYKKPVEFKIPDYIKTELVTLAKPEPVKPKVTQPKPKATVPVKTKPKPEVKKETSKTPKQTTPEAKVTPQNETINLNPEPVITPEPPAQTETVQEEKVTETETVAEPVVEEALPDIPSEDELFESMMAGLAQEEAQINQKIEAIEAQQEFQQQVAEQVKNYIGAITTQISQQWSRPVELRLIDVSQLEATVLVELLPTGELLGVSLTSPSGNENYDQSVLRAIEKVRRFNVPEDVEIFEAGGFRRLNVTFRPEDLMNL